MKPNETPNTAVPKTKTQKEQAEADKQEAIFELRGLFEKAGYKAYTQLEHVSRSGMLRHPPPFSHPNLPRRPRGGRERRPSERGRRPRAART